MKLCPGTRTIHGNDSAKSVLLHEMMCSLSSVSVSRSKASVTEKPIRAPVRPRVAGGSEAISEDDMIARSRLDVYPSSLQVSQSRTLFSFSVDVMVFTMRGRDKNEEGARTDELVENCAPKSKRAFSPRAEEENRVSMLSCNLEVEVRWTDIIHVM